jgi:hypothetical protein
MSAPVYEQIMQTVEALLEEIPSLTGRISRGEPFIIPGTWPFVHLAQNELDPTPEFGPSTHEVTLAFALTIGVAVNPPANRETALGAHEAEIFAKLYLDPRIGGLGLITWLGRDAPVSGDDEGHGPEIRATHNWQVIYATPYGDPYTALTQ